MRISIVKSPLKSLMKNGGDPFSSNSLKGKVPNTLPNTAAAGSGDLILDTNRTSQEESVIIT